MVTEPLIISIDRFKYFAGIADTFDSEFLAPLIIQATDLLSESVMGKALTDKLIIAYNAGTLTGIYATIYPDIEKMVVFQALVLGLPRMAIRISNGQITTGNSDNPTIDRQRLADLQRGWESSQVHYENRVKSILCENMADIPELSENTPCYLGPNLRASDTSQGTTYTPNNYYRY